MNAIKAFSTKTFLFSVLIFWAGNLCAQAPGSPAGGRSSCVISEFMNLALSTHDPIARTTQVKSWLTNNGALCSPKQLEILKANRSNWLGTSDNVDIFAIVFALQEEQAKSNPAALSELYGFSGVNPIAPRKDETTSSKGNKGAAPGAGAPGGAPGAAAGSPFGQAASPFGQAPSPFGQPASPFGQAASPFGQPASPFGQAASPFGQPASPFGQPASPFGQPASPFGK